MVVFVPADYAGRDWTRLERRAAFSRAVAESGVYVLPARFDDSQLPGLLAAVVVVDLGRYTLGQFADLVVTKLADLAISPSPPPGDRPKWRWDVALSFAGAQRDYVEQVARALQAQGVRCFYDAERISS